MKPSNEELDALRKNLSDNMQRTLWIIAWDDVIKLGAGWFDSQDDKLDGRTVQALFNRCLIEWKLKGSQGTLTSGLRCTELGNAVIERMRETGYRLR